MNYKIIQPLLLEVFTKDELIKRLKFQNETNIRDLKMMSMTLRIPRMCTDFHKVMRYQKGEIRYAEFQQEAKKQLMDWKVVDE